MENVSASENRSNPTVGLRNISCSIIHIEVRPFSIYTTRLEKFPKPIDEPINCVIFIQVLGQLFSFFELQAILIIADNVCNIVNDLLIIFSQFGQKSHKRFVQDFKELIIKFLIHIAKLFVEFFGGVLIFIHFLVFIVDLSKTMECIEEKFFLQKTKVFGLKYFPLGKRHIFECFAIKMQHILDQPKLHVFIHVRLTK